MISHEGLNRGNKGFIYSHVVFHMENHAGDITDCEDLSLISLFPWNTATPLDSELVIMSSQQLKIDKASSSS